MKKVSKSFQELTDEEVLNEFVKRFQCDGAILVYLDSTTECGFGQWRNSLGRKWVNNIFKILNPKTIKTQNSFDCNAEQEASFSPIF